MKFLLSIALILSPFIPSLSAYANDNDVRWLQGIAGVNPPDSEDRALTHMGRDEVLDLVLALEERGPIPAHIVCQMLAGSSSTIEELVRVSIIRPIGDRYGIGFSYFSEDDMRSIRASAERHVPALVEAYLQEAPKLREILADYPADGVSDEQLAYMLIIGMALNWDALKQTEAEGYRTPILVEGDGWAYSFWAAKEPVEFSSRGYFWGSSSIFATPALNFPDNPVDFDFSSFGDPHSEPRMNFPDLLYLDLERMAPSIRATVIAAGPMDEEFAGISFENILGISRARAIADILFALRTSNLNLSQLEALPALTDEPVAELTQLLLTLGYVRLKDGGAISLSTPVLDHADRKLVQTTMAWHRDIFDHWLTERFPVMKAELSDLTMIQHGLTFEQAFTQVWHEYFGLATRELVAAGFASDPYADNSVSPGSLAMLWRTSVYERDVD